jgi:hypothetical protein
MFSGLPEVEEYAITLMKEFNIYKKVNLVISKRLVVDIGQFIYDIKDEKPKIKLSAIKIVANLENRAYINDAIRHEIAHALDYFKRGFTCHDDEFKRIAYKIGSDGQMRSKDFFKFKTRVSKKKLQEEFEKLDEFHNGN